MASKKLVFLGRLGENEARVIQFHVDEGYTYTVLNRRPNDTDAYPVPSENVTVDGSTLYWTVMSGDVAQEGLGECQVVESENGKIVKTEVYDTRIGHALDGSGDPPEPWESWVHEVTEAAETAEAYAVGTRGGVDVEPGDPAYNNNSEYYAGQAAGSAQDADGAKRDAVSAKNDAVTAKNDAVNAKNDAVNAKNDAVDAKTAAQTAQGKAEDAEGTATQKAQAASGSADAAAADALKAEGYANGKQNGTAVGSGSPYYHNNADYFRGQASISATAAAGSATAAADSAALREPDVPSGKGDALRL